VFTGPTTGSRFQNDTAAVLPVNVGAGTTASGIDLDNGINMSSGGTTATFAKTGAGVMRLNNAASSASWQVNGGTVRIDTDGGAGSGTTNPAGSFAVNSGGTLAVVGGGTTASGAAVTVNGGGTLNGTGVVNGAVTVNAGGVLRGGVPGGTGALAVANVVTVNNGGVLRAEVAGSTSTASRVNVTGAGGALALGTAPGNTFVIDLVSNPGDPLVYGTPYTVTLANVVSGSVTVNGSGAFGTIDPATYTLQSASFPAFSNVTLTANFGALTLNFTPVPEPGTVFGAAGGVLGLGALARRLRRRTAA
jgi:hypothetical protein